MTVLATRRDVRQYSTTFESMASDIEIRIVDPVPDVEAQVAAAVAEITSMATHLTRFDPTSALSRLNRAPDRWHRVPGVLADAIAEAHLAHLATGGLFDPRVLDTLVGWGYDATFSVTPSHGWPLATPLARAPQRPRPTWRPDVVAGELVHTAGARIDLGGIGKGLAVRRAATALTGAGSAVLVDAGGDQWLSGPGPDGGGWKVGVEDPHGAAEPVLVLVVADLACATSSIGALRWTAAGVPVHHLVDPRTGAPGGAGLASVTVLHPDPAWAEVWAKALFLTGADDIAATADQLGLAAAWVRVDTSLGLSAACEPHVMWRADR